MHFFDCIQLNLPSQSSQNSPATPTESKKPQHVLLSERPAGGLLLLNTFSVSLLGVSMTSRSCWRGFLARASLCVFRLSLYFPQSRTCGKHSRRHLLPGKWNTPCPTVSGAEQFTGPGGPGRGDRVPTVAPQCLWLWIQLPACCQTGNKNTNTTWVGLGLVIGCYRIIQVQKDEPRTDQLLNRGGRNPYKIYHYYYYYCYHQQYCFCNNAPSTTAEVKLRERNIPFAKEHCSVWFWFWSSNIVLFKALGQRGANGCSAWTDLTWQLP